MSTMKTVDIAHLSILFMSYISSTDVLMFATCIASGLLLFSLTTKEDFNMKNKEDMDRLRNK